LFNEKLSIEIKKYLVYPEAKKSRIMDINILNWNDISEIFSN
jgi:hypothetical protein